MEFFIIDAEEIDRHVEPKDYLVSNKPRYEEITIQIRLVGSGDTSEFNTEGILRIIRERLKTIQPTK